MERLSDTDHPIHDLLLKRWSPRAFASRSIEPEKLRAILEAARWAPSCFNEQPWSFLVATKNDPEEFARMLSCLVEGNQKWAKSAPVLMISVAARNFKRSSQPNRHAFHDVGLATENLLLQATALGLQAHPMAGFSPEKARELYGIPEDSEAVAAIAAGYPGDPQSLPEDLRKKELAPRTRKPLQDFVFTARWGQSSSSLWAAD